MSGSPGLVVSNSTNKWLPDNVTHLVIKIALIKMVYN